MQQIVPFGAMELLPLMLEKLLEQIVADWFNVDQLIDLQMVTVHPPFHLFFTQIFTGFK